MAIYRQQLNRICEVTESIYTFSITAKENKLRSNMKILREMFQCKRVNPSTISRECLSNCLWFAVLDQDAVSVQEILKYNPDTNLIRSNINMLWMSIIRNNIKIAKLLVEGGADVNVRIPDGGPTFLHFLVTMVDSEESLELAKMMIKKGADVNAYTGRSSVLQTAVMHQAVHFVKELLDNGARFKGIDLILLAARSSKSSELLPLLVNSIRDVGDRHAWIFGAMQCLIENDVTSLDEIRALLKLDDTLPVLGMDIDGWTILRIAVHFGKIDVVKLLLDYDVEMNQKKGKGSLALLWSGPNITLNESHKLIIKHLATLVFNEAVVYDSDLEKICDCPKMTAYYEKCLSDLQNKE